MNEQLENIISMLQSPDEENHVVALGILNTDQFCKREGYLALCYKKGLADLNSWKTHAPNAVLTLNQSEESVTYIHEMKRFTYDDIWRMIRADKSVKIDEVTVFLKFFGEFMTETLRRKYLVTSKGEHMNMGVQIKINLEFKE